MAEVLDGLLVKICKPQKAFYFFYFDRGFLLFNCFDVEEIPILGVVVR